MAEQRIFAEYTRMRSSGIDMKTTLNILRSEIEALSERERQELANQLRSMETGSASRESEKTEPTRTMPIRSIAKKKGGSAQQKANDVVWVNCPHCGKSNQRHELLCYSCGHILEPQTSEFETRTLSETNDLSYSNDFFNKDSTLILQVRGSDEVYQMRPQDRDHEIVIGRSTNNSAVVPDLDVSVHSGDTLGVSRLHLTIRYEAKGRTLSVFDLGSSNGSYINGQRLHPHEVRVLHDGDELRLGKLVMSVRFKHS